MMQPSFYYSTFLMVVSLVSSILLIRINGALGARWRSVLLVAPLAAALIALIFFPPSITVPLGAGPLPHHPIGGQAPPGGPFLPEAGPAMQSILSVTGSLMIVGLVLGAASAAVSVIFSGGITRRLLQVVDLDRTDFPGLTADMEELAGKLGIAVPRLGLVEDLRPNAFTFGTGNRTTVVFTLGMLTVLDRRELRAVAAHELAHVLNRDLWFKASTRALAWTFFFNPAARLAVKAAHRERERLADDTARSMLGESASLARAIEKVSGMSEGDRSRSSLVSRFGLSMTMSLMERGALLSDHPTLADRTRQLRDNRSRRRLGPAACLVLSLAVILAGIALTVSMGDVRADIMHSVIAPHAPAEDLPDLGPGVTEEHEGIHDLRFHDRSHFGHFYPVDGAIVHSSYYHLQ